MGCEERVLLLEHDEAGHSDEQQQDEADDRPNDDLDNVERITCSKDNIHADDYESHFSPISLISFTSSEYDNDAILHDLLAS